MAMNIGRGSKTTISEINVTPMADVMIVLLIIFMVTVPLIGRPVQLPDAAQAKERRGERIEVVLNANGAITVGKDAFSSAAALGDYLALRLAGRSSPTVVIQADRNSSYSEVANILDVCRRAGAPEIALAARQPLGRP